MVNMPSEFPIPSQITLKNWHEKIMFHSTSLSDGPCRESICFEDGSFFPAKHEA